MENNNAMFIKYYNKFIVAGDSYVKNENNLTLKREAEDAYYNLCCGIGKFFNDFGDKEKETALLVLKEFIKSDLATTDYPRLVLTEKIDEDPNLPILSTLAAIVNNGEVCFTPIYSDAAYLMAYILYCKGDESAAPLLLAAQSWINDGDMRRLNSRFGEVKLYNELSEESKENLLKIQDECSEIYSCDKGKMLTDPSYKPEKYFQEDIYHESYIIPLCRKFATQEELIRIPFKEALTNFLKHAPEMAAAACSLETEPETPEDSNLEKDIDCEMFKSAFNAGAYPIILKNNPAYQDKFNGMIPYITYDDVLAYRCIIHAYPSDGMPSFGSNEGNIICKYDSIEDMVSDGWRVD